jgi:P27 family predicted phage terminase small subunit
MDNSKIISLIKEALKSKGQYEDIDDTLLTELVFNIEMAEECRANIKAEGIRINVTTRKGKKPYYVKNQSYVIYLTVIKTITSILADLGLTPRERNKIKSAITEEDQFSISSKDYE